MCSPGPEKLHDDTRKLWMEKFGIRILEGYGATECSPVISVNTMIGNKTGSVGRLAPGMQAYLAPVAGIHNGGRLVVKGPNVMSGYLLHGTDGNVHAAAHGARGGLVRYRRYRGNRCRGIHRTAGTGETLCQDRGEMISLTAVEELAGVAWPGSQPRRRLPARRAQGGKNYPGYGE